MLTALRSYEFMPQVRWIRHLTPPPESLGPVLRRLRMERDLDQEDVAKALGLSSTSISNYETDKSAPTRHVLRRLNEYFAQPPNTLSTILRNYQAWEEAQEPVPGPGMAVPAEPVIIEGVEEYLKFDDSQMPAVTELLRVLRSGPHISEETIRETIDAYLAFQKEMESPD